MNLVGDEEGLKALHEMKGSNREYLKFLIQEARTVFGGFVDFKSKDGAAYRLTWDPRDQRLVVSRPG